MAATEWWQRGPVDGVPEMLQPVAHVVLQVGESVREIVEPLTEAQWNARPASVASVAFHVRHIIGVLDRLFSYARGDALTDAQFVALRAEGQPVTINEMPRLLDRLDAQIANALSELKSTDPAILGEYRGVGRAQLPSTVIGCLVHAAEHGMRHVGQLSVTARIVCDSARVASAP